MVDLVALGDRDTMIYVYVIKSKHKKFRYVGITSSITRRIKEHNSGKNLSTKPYAPFDFQIKEKYDTYAEARNREVFLKSGQGRKFLDSL